MVEFFIDYFYVRCGDVVVDVVGSENGDVFVGFEVGNCFV